MYPLSRIHNTSLVSSYFGLDKRGCEYLEYYYYYYFKGISAKIGLQVYSVTCR
jgi:hypothetical protein